MKKVIYLLFFVLVLCFAITAIAEESQKVSVGDNIIFGHYEQDNNIDNGSESIEWIVLDVQDGKALLLSKYGLETKEYNTGDYEITWERSTLRSWLNNDFINNAFSPEEQSAIIVTEVDNSDAQGFDWSTVGGSKTTGGNNTHDQIFLLSYMEANRYLNVKIRSEDDGRNIASRVAPTAYAAAQGAFYFENSEYLTTDGVQPTQWWLRSPGAEKFRAAYVFINGSLYESPVAVDDIVVCPALWLDIESAANLSFAIPQKATVKEETTEKEGNVVETTSGDNRVTVGDVIIFGNYEQDNNMGNGPESIEWIVLDVQDDKALMLSKYGLDSKAYNNQLRDATWETCTLRAWLNNDFFNLAFNKDEQAIIMNVEVDNGADQCYSNWNTSGGNNTSDRVFLLSCMEANRYLGANYCEDDDGSNMISRTTPTAYAIAQGAITYENVNFMTAEGVPAGLWWLRSPGKSQERAANVRGDGPFSDCQVQFDDRAVRPAFWLNLESGIF